jgi:hypothetical protein
MRVREKRMKGSLCYTECDMIFEFVSLRGTMNRMVLHCENGLVTKVGQAYWGKTTYPHSISQSITPTDHQSHVLVYLVRPFWDSRTYSKSFMRSQSEAPPRQTRRPLWRHSLYKCGKGQVLCRNVVVLNQYLEFQWHLWH